MAVRADGSVDFITNTIEWHVWMKLNAMRLVYRFVSLVSV